MQYRSIKIGNTYHVEDVFGDIVPVRVSSKENKNGYRIVKYDYLDGNEYFGCKQGITYSKTTELESILS